MTSPPTTQDAVASVKRAVPRKAWPSKVHVATRTFQALRIAVNDELGELERVLVALPRLLRVGGRAAVIAFHSLEDRAVKQAFRTLEGRCTCPPGLPGLRLRRAGQVRRSSPGARYRPRTPRWNAIPGRAARGSGPWRGWHEPEVGEGAPGLARRGAGADASGGAVLRAARGGRHPPRRLAEPGGGRGVPPLGAGDARAAPSPWPTTGSKLELATLKRPARLEAIARAQLGMAPPEASVVDSVAARPAPPATHARRGSAHAGRSPLAAMIPRRSTERGRPPAELTRWTRARVLVMGGAAPGSRWRRRSCAR